MKNCFIEHCEFSHILKKIIIFASNEVTNKYSNYFRTAIKVALLLHKK